MIGNLDWIAEKFDHSGAATGVPSPGAESFSPSGARRDHLVVVAAPGRADAYESLEAKAASLLHSLARNRALVDGNERLALAATIAFLGVNGKRLTFSNDQAYELVAAGQLDDVAVIAECIRNASELADPHHQAGGR